ncbi:DNA polymerase IV [Paraconexibacter antarcticus]|uniref:DNA polymerase IV n=1 Tax=Paraconexibacter antarcticus TaxID=2949664 RepID=A0ABY5DVR5_9ACTN|nr:DNA polymerase IV [Paraconexibacter antarcticus]UTI66098.1 DNA polymerase IV [Paraconexibacter antarcticus]
MAVRRVIAHLDADAFYATCHELLDPSLRGRPVIVGGSGPRSIVTTASYPARRFGVGSAMPMSRALRLCPGAVVIPPDRELYTTTSRRVWELVGAALLDAGAVYEGEDGPIAHLEQAGIDEAYAELVQIEKPLAFLRGLIADVREQTGIQLSAGISPSRLISKISSDLEKPAAFVVLSREQALERLAGRPLSIVPGIGPKAAETLAQLGFRTLADLTRADPAMLLQTFGESRGSWLAQVADLSVDVPLQPVRRRKSISSEHTFEEDVGPDPATGTGAPAPLREQIEKMAAEVAEAARRRSFRGRNVAVKIRTGDWRTYTRATTLPDYTDDAALITAEAVRLWEQHRPPEPVRLLGVRLGAFEHVERHERAAGDASGDDASPQLRLALE